MTRTTPLALLLALPAAAAPLPEAERERLEFARAYGTWTDPLGDCTYRVAGGQLRVRLPEHPRIATEWVPGPVQAPRFTRTVSGDFTATVRVHVPVQPDRRIDNGGEGPMLQVAAGLTAEDGAAHRAGCRRCEKLSGGGRVFVESAWRKGMNEGGGAGHGGAAKEDRTYLRMRRTGATVRFWYGSDGEKWDDLGAVEIGWAGPVTLGLVAENSVGVPVEVTFDHFTLTRPEDGPK